jgi:solute carrier family 25 S-adenosylmethionine transporter 26
LADIIALMIRNPFEVIKQNLQFREFHSTKAAFKSIWQQRGLRGFYTGYTALLSREVPISIVEMPLYEYFMKLYLLSNLW